jgi:hypothetical protein
VSKASLTDSAANTDTPPFFDQVVASPHSVVTAHLIDEVGQPTLAARDACRSSAIDLPEGQQNHDQVSSLVLFVDVRQEGQTTTLTGMRRRAACSAFNGRITLISCN